MRVPSSCRTCSTTIVGTVLPVLLLTSPLTAAIFFWDSNQQASDWRRWSDHLNWAGPTNEFPNGPADGVYVSGVSGWDPILDGNYNIGSLTVQLGGDASTGEGTAPGALNYRLGVVTSPLFGGTGLTLLKDSGSSLTVYRSSNMNDLDTDDLLIKNGAALKLRYGAGIQSEGAIVQVDDLLDIDPGGRLDGEGAVEFTRDDGTNDPRNDGLIQAFGGTLRFFGHADTLFDLDGPSENGALEASYSSTLIIDTNVENIFDGTMTIGSRAEIQINRHWIQADGSTLTFDGGSGDDRAILSGTSVSFGGTVLVNSDASVSATAVIGNQALVTLAAGTTLEFDDFLSVDNASSIQGAGQLHMSDGAMLNLEGGSSVDVAVHSNGQTLIGGSGPDVVSVGSFVQGATGRIDFRFCAPSAGGFDQLQVTGTATLDGQLDLAAIQTCEQSPGTEFPIITAASITGQFAQVTGMPNVVIVYGPTSVTVIVTELCAADLDGDGAISVTDLLTVLGGWGTPNGDVTGDGMTDVVDLLAVLQAWGSCG